MRTVKKLLAPTCSVLSYFFHLYIECGSLEVDEITSSSFRMSWLAPCETAWAGVDEYVFHLSNDVTGEIYGDLR